MQTETPDTTNKTAGGASDVERVVRQAFENLTINVGIKQQGGDGYFDSPKRLEITVKWALCDEKIGESTSTTYL